MIWKPRRTGRPSDDAIMAHLRDELIQMTPQLVDGCRIEKGMLVGASGWALMALPNHTRSPNHFDIGFVISVESPERAVVPDCIHGLGSPAEAADVMRRIWRETSGACFAEMLTSRSEFAVHLDGSERSGLPGWHSVVSGVIGYGLDGPSNTALQMALLDHHVLRTLAPQLTPALNRPANNGIKVFYHRTRTSATAEIRVNGVPNPGATQALAELPWPEVGAPTTARFYAVAVNPA